MADERMLIQAEYESMERMSCVPTNIHKVRADHVFDKDKSVKWNREQVEDNNRRYLEEVKRLNTEKNRRRDELHERIYKAIQDEVGYGLSRRKAMLLWNSNFTKIKTFTLTSMRLVAAGNRRTWRGKPNW